MSQRVTSHGSRVTVWWGLGGVGALLVVVGLVALWPPDLSTKSQALELEVQRQLGRAGMRRSRLLQETRILARHWGRSYHVVEADYRCPSRFSPEAFLTELERALPSLGFELLRVTRRHTPLDHRGLTGHTPEARVTAAELGYRHRRLYRLTLHEPAGPPARRAKVAIVLDDWGYNRALVPEVLRLDRPVTFAVLPHRPYSKAVSETAQRAGHDVILHLPMEPHDADSPREPKVLAPGMSAAVVRQMLDQALATVPQARGVSNHQGSKATEDAQLMRTLLSELRQRRFLFLDSVVTDRSVCRQIAAEVGLPFAQRAVFLDNTETPEAVRRQLLELAEVAQRTGEAVGIGHDKRVMIEALRELMPRMEQEGIEFVRLSELTQVVTSN